MFTFGPDFNPVLDRALVESASVTLATPQTIVYKINPKATWSDGTPVTGADFVYNWQAQSGMPGATDVGGKPFQPAATAGYGGVRSVTVSSASADVVTVVLSAPDPDWTRLFSHLMPAHVAQRVGFNAGFTDPVADLVSDGPYVVVSYDPSGVVRLARNPAYAGSPAAALEFDVHYLPAPSQIISAVAAGQISCAQIPGTPTGFSSLKGSGTLTVGVSPSASYADLLFNAARSPMSSSDERAAVTKAISPASVIADVLRGADPQYSPVTNRFLVPGETGYSASSPPPAPGVQRPTSTTMPTGLRLAVTSSDPLVVATSQAIAQELDAAGLAVTVDPVADLSKLPSATWDMALVVRQLTPWPATAITAYGTGQATNVGRISDPALDSAIQSALSAPAGQEKSLVDQVDQSAWEAYADYPIFALPDILACQTGVTGPVGNASPDGPAYNAAGWGLRGGSS